jgi:hypothetical protein
MVVLVQLELASALVFLPSLFLFLGINHSGASVLQSWVSDQPQSPGSSSLLLAWLLLSRKQSATHPYGSKLQI